MPLVVAVAVIVSEKSYKVPGGEQKPFRGVKTSQLLVAIAVHHLVCLQQGMLKEVGSIRLARRLAQ